jgi:hypothetical protein
MKETITVDGALKKLRDTPEDDHIPSPDELGQGDLINAVIELQNRIAGLTYSNEALIDILKAFDILNIDIFDIAYQNVREYDRSPIETRKLVEIRARALKKKLADFSRSKSQLVKAPPAEPAKPGKRQLKEKKHG